MASRMYVSVYVKDGRLYSFVVGKKTVANHGRFDGSTQSEKAIRIVAAHYKRNPDKCRTDTTGLDFDSCWMEFY